MLIIEKWVTWEIMKKEAVTDNGHNPETITVDFPVCSFLSFSLHPDYLFSSHFGSEVLFLLFYFFCPICYLI